MRNFPDRKNRLVQKWRENMKKPAEYDSDFEAFLRQEAKEIDEIFALFDKGDVTNGDEKEMSGKPD